jgi:hypothetical protein
MNALQKKSEDSGSPSVNAGSQSVNVALGSLWKSNGMIEDGKSKRIGFQAIPQRSDLV